MEENSAAEPLDLQVRLRRSRGRSGRVLSLTVKLTREERDLLQSRAASKKQAAGEWAREQLLALATLPSKEDILLTELIGLRMVVVNLLGKIAIDKDYTEDKYRALLDHVRQDKRSVTSEVIEQYRQLQKD